MIWTGVAGIATQGWHWLKRSVLARVRQCGHLGFDVGAGYCSGSVLNGVPGSVGSGWPDGLRPGGWRGNAATPGSSPRLRNREWPWAALLLLGVAGSEQLEALSLRAVVRCPLEWLGKGGQPGIDRQCRLAAAWPKGIRLRSRPSARLGNGWRSSRLGSDFQPAWRTESEACQGGECGHRET